MFYEKQRLLLFANFLVRQVAAENSKARSSQKAILQAANIANA